LLWIVPVVLAMAVSVLFVTLATSLPDRQTVAIVNRTRAPVTVWATGEKGGGWYGLGTADPRSRTVIESVADQGGVWRFRLRVGPTVLGEIRRTADQLRASGWTVTIPADSANALPEAERP
jgi:hypothetical protein